MRAESKWLPGAAACAAMILSIGLASPVAAAPTATATIVYQPVSGGFQYDITLDDTSGTTIGTYWFSWVPGEDFMTTSPTSIVAPANWTDQVTHAGAGDGYAIQFVAGSTGLLAAGKTLAGFQFDSSMTPAQLAGNSTFFATTPVTTSFVYSGAPFSDTGFQFVASSINAAGWTGASDTNWANSANWGGAIPGATSGTTNTGTATFNQSAAHSPTTIDAGRNLMNITFDTANVSALTIGTTGGNSLLLTSGGTIQTTSTVLDAEAVNAPLLLEGSYTFTSGATAAALSFGGAIKPAATSGTTTLTLDGGNKGLNTIGGALTDNGSVHLAVSVGGTGEWVFNGTAKTYSGATTIAAGATLELTGSVTQLNLSMNVANSGSLVAAGSVNQHVASVSGGTAAAPLGSTSVSAGAGLTALQIVQNSLTIHGTGTTAAIAGSVTLVPSGGGSSTNPTGPNNTNFSSTITSLSIDNNGATLASGARVYFGTLDIGNNGLVIEYGAAANDPYATVDDMIRAGFDSAHWDGTGITSSLARAAANSHTPLNIGLLDFTPGQHGDGTFMVFQGQTITTNAILVGLTYMDDINLFGDMSLQHAASDALLFAANFGVGTTWSVGDLTHDGAINSADALLFAANYATGLPSLDGTTGSAAMLGGNTAAVPEPAGIVLAGLGALLVLGRFAQRHRAFHFFIGKQ